MIPCIYTKDKKKKLKTWLDGFVSLSKNTLKLYNEDKKQIDSKTCNELTNDLETFKHLIYIESLEAQEEIKSFIEEKPEVKAEEADTTIEQAVGRSNKDILNLFKSGK